MYSGLTKRRRSPAATDGDPLADRDWIVCDLHMHTSWSHDCRIEVLDLLDHAEEIGLGGHTWDPILEYWSSAGFTDERVHLFRARDLFEQHADRGEDERIETVQWPLASLDEAIAECGDAKTLIGLMWLARQLG